MEAADVEEDAKHDAAQEVEQEEQEQGDVHAGKGPSCSSRGSSHTELTIFLLIHVSFYINGMSPFRS